MKAQLASKPWLWLGIGMLGAGCVPWIASDFVASVALSCLMYIALATSWSLFCGATRYLSLATSAFFGLGAYASATLLELLPWPLVILSGAAIASAVAVLMGAAVLHLRGTYFAVLTFGMTELIRHAVTFVEKQVSGTVGRVLTVVPSNETVYLTVLAIAGGAIACAIVVKRSRFGLALAGIGADEQRAQTLGVDTRRIKIAGFALTAIEPAAVFSPFIGFQTVLIALIGGAASIGGPVLAAVVFSLLAETLRLQLPYGYMMVLGLLLILCVMYLPNGLASLWQRRAVPKERSHG